MFTKINIIILIFCFCMGSVYGEGKIIDSLGNVQLKTEDKFNQFGNKFGVDYFAVNQNQFPVYVSIDAIVQKNIYEGLVPGQFLISPGENAYLGWIIHEDHSQDAKWELEWDVEALEHTDISTP